MRLPCLFTDLFIITIVIIIIIFLGWGVGGGGGGPPDPWTLRPFFLGPLGPQFGLKIRGIRGEGGPPLDPSLQEA